MVRRGGGHHSLGIPVGVRAVRANWPCAIPLFYAQHSDSDVTSNEAGSGVMATRSRVGTLRPTGAVVRLVAASSGNGYTF
ncbi:hypothetical protein LBMAG38_07420 [Chloroflexota bacterium]|nr:hypothetical protein LBMAG38_07420 [Chloroflexota bacterium]